MSTVATKKQQRKEIEKQRRQEMLLGIIYLFSPLHREISVLEIQNYVSQFQQKQQLGYSFSKWLNYSNELMEDLEDLINMGALQEYNNGNDSFSRKGHLTLTDTGTGKGKETVSQLSIDVLEYLEQEYLQAI
jgi:uncharacterized protein YwgA